MYPAPQEHKKEPLLLMQIWSQPPLPVAHSSISNLYLCGHLTVNLMPLGFVVKWPSVWCHWALWSCDCQSDDVGLCASVWCRWALCSCHRQSGAVGLCGHVTFSLVPLGFVVMWPSVWCRWALWSCDHQDDSVGLWMNFTRSTNAILVLEAIYFSLIRESLIKGHPWYRDTLYIKHTSLKNIIQYTNMFVVYVSNFVVYVSDQNTMWMSMPVLIVSVYVV